MHVVARFLPIISLFTYKGKGDDDDGAGVTQVGSVSDVLAVTWYQLSSVVGSYNADLLTYRLAQEWGQLDGANNHVWRRATVERLVDEDHLANIKKAVEVCKVNNAKNLGISLGDQVPLAPLMVPYVPERSATPPAPRFNELMRATIQEMKAAYSAYYGEDNKMDGDQVRLFAVYLAAHHAQDMQGDYNGEITQVEPIKTERPQKRPRTNP